MGFDPASLAIIATIGSTAIQGIGAMQQSKAAAASAGYNAQVAAQNAQIQTQNAQFAASEGNQNLAVEGAKTKAALAATVAAQGASGVDINTGSAVDVRASEAKLGMLDALTIRSNAAKQAYGYQVGAASATGQAALDRAQAKSATKAGYLNAASTVLGGVGQAAMYSKYLTKTSPVGDFSGFSFTGEGEY